MGPFIDEIHFSRMHSIGHHKSWGINGDKRFRLLVSSHEIRRLESATRKRARRLANSRPTFSTGGSQMN